MLSSLRHFYRKPARLIAILCLLGPVYSVQSLDCNSSPVFAFSQALYLQQYDRAIELLPRVKLERSPELAKFLERLMQWKRAYDTNDRGVQLEALTAIDKQIGLLNVALQAKPSRMAELELTAGNIKTHAARLNLAMGRVLKAARLAKQGNQLINKVLERNPGQVDAYLAAGLYQYYSGSDDSGLSWIKQLFSLQGDQQQGRDLIEKAMQLSPDYAFEAARSLKMELDWNKYEVCHYPGLITSDLPESNLPVEVLQLEVSVDLFCGRTEQAIKLIQQLSRQIERAQSIANVNQKRWIDDANLYALSQQGEAELLVQLMDSGDFQSNSSRKQRIEFSLAKALDVKRERALAKQLYQKLLDEQTEPAYKTLAQQYLKEAYRYAPLTENQKQAFACGD